MRSNGLLTFLFYALLGLLVIAGGYQACKMRKEKADLAKQDAEMKKYWTDMGSPAADTSAASGSSYSGSDVPSATVTVTNADGIEDEGSRPTTTSTTTTAPPAQKPVAPKTVAPAPTTSTKTTSVSTTPKLVSPQTTTKGNGTAGLGTGRYSVRVGSFSSIDNARTQLEKVIKLGYPNASIGKTNGGKFSTVVVYRSNDRAAAVRVMDKLESQGVDALVHDTRND